MNATGVYSDLRIPNRVMIELHGADSDARDVIVEMEDGEIYTALFVTPAYMIRQMELTFEVCQQLQDATPTRFAALDTPHIVVTGLSRDIIEDTIDNLLAMEIFASVFTQVTDSYETTDTTTSNGNGRRATQEVAAVVLSDVLVVEM